MDEDENEEVVEVEEAVEEVVEEVVEEEVEVVVVVVVLGAQVQTETKHTILVTSSKQLCD